MGWHILKVEDHQSKRQLKFEEARKEIAAALQRKRQREKQEAFILALKVGARIEYPNSKAP